MSATSSTLPLSLLANPAELLHQKLSKTSKSKNIKKRVLEYRKKGKKKVEREVVSEEEKETGVELLDMHRKIVAEVMKVRFDEWVVIVEHVPGSDSLAFYFISLKGRTTGNI
jgi:hypothetical protein